MKFVNHIRKRGLALFLALAMCLRTCIHKRIKQW